MRQHNNSTIFYCHPLREDVSWNIDIAYKCGYSTKSSSSWGCELKCIVGCRCPLSKAVILFVRMWVEIPTVRLRQPPWSVIFFVRMWVEIVSGDELYTGPTVILFVRMWVEMMLDTVVLVQVAVILLVKMWVEILKNTVLIIVVAIWFFLWGGELKYLWSSFSASHEGVTIIHYLIWILNSIIEILEEIFTCVLRKNEQHLVVSPIFIWYLNVE